MQEFVPRGDMLKKQVHGMELNYVIVMILQMLFSSNGNILLSDALEHLGITRRILLYNLKKLNYALNVNGFPQIGIFEERLVLDMTRRDEIKNTFLARSDDKVWDYVLSRDERKVLILLSVGLMRNHTLETLAESLETSKNTTVSDISVIKADLEKEGLSLVSRGRSGYRIEGDELTLRFCLYKAVADVHSDFMQTSVDDVFLSAAAARAGAKKDPDLLKKIRQIVEDAEKKTNLAYNYDAINELVYYIILIFCRAKIGRLYIDDSSLTDTAEYEAARIIMDKAGELGLVIPQEEKAYLTAVLLSERGMGEDVFKTPGEVNLSSFVNDLIEEFESLACVVIENREAFARQLLRHVRPMYYRLKFKIKTTSINSGDIRSEYPDIFNYTCKAVRRVDTKYGFTVCDEEIAYICIYFISWMANNKLNPKQGERSILIVCGAGIGTALFLQHQVSELIGKSYIIDTKDLRNADEEDLEKYDLIITTVDLPYDREKIMRVDAVLSPVNKNIILNHFPPDDTRSEDTIVSNLLMFIDQNAVITNRVRLVETIRKYFEAFDADLQQVRLRDVLTPKTVFYFKDSYDPETAIRIVCEPLVKAGLTDEEYAESILCIISEKGLYSEISPGILLTHAHPTLNTKGVGLALGVFQQGVAFKKSGKEKIRVVFALCTPNNKAHLTVLRNLFDLLEDADFTNTLKTKKFADSRDLFDYISSHMKMLEK